MKKNLLLISFFIILNLINEQNFSNAIDKNQRKSYLQSYFNTSKYDSEKNWSTVIKEDDAQGSINSSEQKPEEDFYIYLKNSLIVTFIIGFLFLLNKIFNRVSTTKNNKDLLDKIIYSTTIKHTPINKSSVNSKIKNHKKNEEQIAIEILESQINFLEKIIDNRNNIAICKNIEITLEYRKAEILTAEASHNLIAKYKAISRVTELMFIGLNEGPALLKTKNDLTEQLACITKETLDDKLKKVYQKI